MPEPTYLICLDDYHLGDPLFVQSLAQQMGRASSRPRCLFVHGGGEHAERALEAQGIFPERREGALVLSSPDEAALVERAVRRLNRTLVGALTDAVVHAVGIQGTDRGLLRRDADGTVRTGSAGWLPALSDQGVVPVVSTLVPVAGSPVPEPAPLAEVAVALAHLFDTVHLVFFTRGDLSTDPGEQGETPAVSLEQIPSSVLPDSRAIQDVLKAGQSVLLTEVWRLFGGERPTGTYITGIKTP